MTRPQGAFTAERRPLLPRRLKVIVNHTPPALNAITLSLTHTHTRRNPVTNTLLSTSPSSSLFGLPNLFAVISPEMILSSRPQVAVFHPDVVFLDSH